MKCSLKTAIPTLAMAFALMLCVTDAMAQGPGRGGRQRGGRDRGGATENPQRLLQSEAVQNELEMTEEQLELLKELNEGQERGQGVDREAMRAEMEGLSQEERMAKFREMRDSRSKSQLEKIGEILLPHQMDRLSQISAQASSRNGARAFTSGALAEKLNITDEQKEKIQARSEELQKELQKEIARLQAEMQAKLLEELTPEQQEEYKAIVGESFTFEQRQRGGDRGVAGGRNRGQRGGGAEGRRGGNRGARGGRGGNRDGDEAL
jgi:hypothetical protein